MSIDLTNTAAVATATAIIEAKATRKTSRKLTPEQEEGREKTLQALQARAEQGTRVTYARFAELARENGWIGESPMSDGQRGSSLIGQVPEDLQFAVCQASGRYSKKAAASFADHLPNVGQETVEGTMAYLRLFPVEVPGGNVKTFKNLGKRVKKEKVANTEGTDVVDAL